MAGTCPKTGKIIYFGLAIFISDAKKWVVPVNDRRLQIRKKLHQTYLVQAFDNADVWAGNLSVELDGIRFGATMARAFLKSDGEVEARVRVELYMAGMDLSAFRAGDVDVRLWTDVNELGFVDERGMFRNAPGHHVPMYLEVDGYGHPALSGNNLVFESDVLHIHRTGVFHYTAEFSADGKAVSEPSKAWISVNDIALNRDGVLAISPERIRQCPTISELCVRKVGARVLEDGAFVSGTFAAATETLARIPTDVVYLLPFFEPGFKDLHTGEDVRKGQLGSVYAVKDFFRVDPGLVSPLETVDFLELVSKGLIRDRDLQDILSPKQQRRLQKVGDFNHFRTREDLVEWVGCDRLGQLVGRAELRALVGRAHALGKQVIFDLVLMQTSRDCPLIAQHPEWYVMDESGRPKIHQIAWLVYSDVALLNLPFNKPLQNYLSSVAPFWMRACDLDGVRIDASQTVDRPFLKQIKNRINLVKPDAIVLGETLCDLNEAIDIPVDMIYALMVDFHRDAAHGNPYIDFLERTFATFAPRTVAKAYFENHDSPRATRIWHERYAHLLGEHKEARMFWGEQANGHEPAHLMALLRNFQCSLINASAGAARHTNLAYALEWGSEWGEEARTDFEEPTLLHPELQEREPYAHLFSAYSALREVVGNLPELRDGHIYFFRNHDPGGDPEDRVLAYARYTPQSGVLAVHNLDPCQDRQVVCPVGNLPGVALARVDLAPVVDTYAFFFEKPERVDIALVDAGVSICLKPLQSAVVRLSFR